MTTRSPTPERQGDPAPLAHGRRRRRVALVVCLAAALAAAAWPSAGAPRMAPDSQAYLSWPEHRNAVGEWAPSRRPPAYPLTLEWVGHGRVLLHLQTWVSLASFAGLGWVLAGAAGAGAGGVLALSGAVAPWNALVLTESLTFSALALVAALSLVIARRARAGQGGAFAGLLPATGVAPRPPLLPALGWAGGIAYLVLLRDANFLVLPALVLPFLRYGWRWLGLAAGWLLLLSVVVQVGASREGRFVTPYYSAIIGRVRPMDRAAYLEFREAGMPRALTLSVSPGMRRWLEQEGGRRMYERWVLSRPDSYVVPLSYVRSHDAPRRLRDRYFREAPPGWPERLGDALWALTGPPLWLGAWLLVVPLLEWRWLGRISLPAALAVLLLPTAYVAAFATYHAAGSEALRHTLIAAFAYRIAVVAGLGAAVTAARAAFAERRAAREGAAGA